MALVNSPTVDRAAVLEHLLLSRHSCRAYRPDVVERDIVERLLTIAQRSASWCNTQPWRVILTSGAATDRFREALLADVEANGDRAEFDFDGPGEYTGVYRDRRRASGWALYDAVGIAKGDRAASARQARENFRFFGAPHVAIITTDANQATYGALDAGLYVGAFLLAAESLGLGAIPQAALATRAPFIRDYFGIPADRKVLVGISFGYPDDDHPANSYRTDRADLVDVVDWVQE